MPLTKAIFVDSDEPIDVGQTLAQLLKAVNDISSKVDKIGTEHELQKTQIDSVANKLDAAIANTEVLRQNLAEATTKGDSENEYQEEEQNKDLKTLLECYRNNKNWAALREGLQAILDSTSIAYIQLRNVASDCRRPLYEASCRGYLELVTVLVSHGVLLETGDYQGDRMLHGAAHGDHLAVLELLLRCGAKVNAQNSFGHTPLMYAAQKGHVQIVTCLLRAGADKSTRSVHGLTALDQATMKGKISAVQALSQ